MQPSIRPFFSPPPHLGRPMAGSPAALQAAGPSPACSAVERTAHELAHVLHCRLDGAAPPNRPEASLPRGLAEPLCEFRDALAVLQMAQSNGVPFLPREHRLLDQLGRAVQTLPVPAAVGMAAHAAAPHGAAASWRRFASELAQACLAQSPVRP